MLIRGRGGSDDGGHHQTGNLQFSNTLSLPFCIATHNKEMACWMVVIIITDIDRLVHYYYYYLL